MNRQITCIVCPRGCLLTVAAENDKITVTGNACPRGEKHAVDECTDPVRSLTATVRVSNRPDTMVSVKTAAPVPKGKMMALMAQLREIQVDAPVKIGTVVLENVFGTQIVATKEIL